MRHFKSQSYDYFKYHGKIKASSESFERRKDKYKYAKLAKMVDEENLEDFIIANILAGKTWIGDFLNDEAVSNYRQYKKRKESIVYTFENELSKLFSSGNPKDLFTVPKDSYPKLLWAIPDEVSILTATILSDLIPFVSEWDKKIDPKNDIVWSPVRTDIIKLKPFLRFDRRKIKEVLCRMIEQNGEGEAVSNIKEHSK
jgi:hypothetical protein